MTSTVTDLIGRLKVIGYNLYLDGERVKFRYTLIDNPPIEAKTLLEALKQHKGEVVDYFKRNSWDTLSRLHLATLEEIGRRKPGPEIWDHPGVREAEDRLNGVWLACMKGKACPEDFKKALDRWEGECRTGRT